MKIAIVGGGITGLTIGYYLSKKGHRITIFEKENYLGGLASGFKLGDWYLEKFYHHIFKKDRAIQGLTKDLGIEDIWFWKDCGAPIFYKNKIYPFSTPLDLLKFNPISFKSRLRTGLASLYLKAKSNYHGFEKISAEKWIKKYMGKESWEVIWKLLMKEKFGKYYKKINMSWMWARIHRRSRFLGYPKGGFQIIIDKLVEKIKKNGGRIVLKRKIKNNAELDEFDKKIYTIASPLFLKIFPNLPRDYSNKLKSIKYIGSVAVVLILKKKILDWVYWLNINDEDFPFLLCVEQANLVSEKYYNNLYPFYIGTYTSLGSELFKKKGDLIADEWIKYLGKINKGFKKDWIKEFRVFKERYTQPIFTVDNFLNIPDFETPIKNIYLVNMLNTYPWDRGVNFAVEAAESFVDRNFNKI